MDSALYAPLFNFVAVVGIIFVAGRKPIADIFSSRHETVGGAVKSAQAEHTEAMALLSKAESAQKNLETEVAKSTSDAQVFLAKFKDDTLKSAEKESVRIRQEAKLIIDNEATRAKQNLEKEISLKCIKLASDSLKANVGEADQEKLTQEFMEGLPNGKA